MSTFVDFTDDQIIAAFSNLLSGLSDKKSQVLLRHDIRPFLFEDTGVWHEKNPEGDASCIGFGLVIADAVDADRGTPFVIAVKVHKDSFKHNPQKYLFGLIQSVNKGVGAMEKEMEITAMRQLSKKSGIMIQ